MYPFGSLPANLIAFCGFLRRERGFRIGPGEAHDAARALEVVDLTDERSVRDALRPILSRTAEEAAGFDRAFAAFFFPGPSGVAQPEMPPVRRALGPDDERSEGARIESGRRAAPGDAATEEEPDAGGGTATPVETADEGAAELTLARASYSPLGVDDGGATPVLTRAEPAWRDAARALVRRLHLGLSRRWRPAARGRRFDLRRTLRTSLQTGGETLTPRWLRRPRRTPRFVLLIDGSRSMGAYARTALQVAVALASVTMRVEVFTFSTALQRVTPSVRRAAAGGTCRLESLPYSWGGGTSIGACLREFLTRFGRTLGRETVVIIASDGLDVGEPDALREAIRELHRRAAGLVWLNPLLDTPGYEPTATGMRTARPYLTTFTSVNDVAGFARLSRLVRVRA